MKYDSVAPIIRGLITKDNLLTEKAFSSAIANEKVNHVKFGLSKLYDDYKRRQGQAVLEQLDYAIKDFVMAPYRQFTFDDLVLSDDIRIVTDKIIHEWEKKDVLLDNGLAPCNKVLLEGPPGNGKTSYAIALAKALDLPLLLTNSSLLLDSYLGNSEKHVSMLFSKLPDKCMLFFDEFDALAASRKNADSSASRAYNSIVTTFLIHMESLRPDIFFMAATNVTDFLDKAILRRFDTSILFGAPTQSAKDLYVKKYLERYHLDANDFLMENYLIENAPSFSALEIIMKDRHKQLLLSFS